jgi:hypothetical protein
MRSLDVAGWNLEFRGRLEEEFAAIAKKIAAATDGLQMQKKNLTFFRTEGILANGHAGINLQAGCFFFAQPLVRLPALFLQNY